jgi:hypothetical protein
MELDLQANSGGFVIEVTIANRPLWLAPHCIEFPARIVGKTSTCTEVTTTGQALEGRELLNQDQMIAE